jgi:hypothetical protein
VNSKHPRKDKRKKRKRKIRPTGKNSYRVKKTTDLVDKAKRI